MANSIFGTNLKIAMKKKDEYHTDNGKGNAQNDTKWKI